MTQLYLMGGAFMVMAALTLYFAYRAGSAGVDLEAALRQHISLKSDMEGMVRREAGLDLQLSECIETANIAVNRELALKRGLKDIADEFYVARLILTVVYGDDATV